MENVPNPTPDKSPAPEKNLIPQNPAQVEEWRQQFVGLPQISYGEAMSKIRAGETLKDVKIPFLNLDQMTLERGLSFDHCLMAGFVARGTKFEDSVMFHNCLFSERIEMSAHKEEKNIHKTIFIKGVEMEDCTCDDVFTLRNAEMAGHLCITRSKFFKGIFLDKTLFADDVLLIGPGEAANCTLYLSKLEKGLLIENYEIPGLENKSLDLNKAQIKETVALTHCNLGSNLDLKKATIGGEKSKSAMTIQNCVMEQVDVRESCFHGEVQFSQTEFKGNITGETPKEEHGERTGRPTLFDGDVAFLTCTFHGKCTFHGSRFQNYTNFKKCTLHKGATFNQAEFGGLVSFWETEILDGIHFRKAHFMGRAQFGRVSIGPKSSFNEAIFEDDYTIFDSEALGDIFFSKACFNKTFKLRSVEIAGGLGMEKVSVEGDVKLTGCTIKDRFILSESHLNGSLIASPLTVGTWGTLARTTVRGQFDLGGLQVGVNLPDVVKQVKEKSVEEKDAEEERKEAEEQKQSERTPQGQEESSATKEPKEKGETKGDKPKELGEDVVPGTFYMSEALLYGMVNLCGAKIKGNLAMDKMNVYNEADLTKMTVHNDFILYKSYFRGIVRLSGTRCKNDVDGYKARFKEEVTFNGLECKTLSLSKSSFDGGFTMHSAKIEKDLNLNSVDVDGKADLFQCEFKEIYFKNFLVDHFLISRDALGETLSSERVKNYLQAANEFGTLKQAFQQRHEYQDMDWAYYRFCQNKRRCRKASIRHPVRSLLVFFEWLLLDLGFGYGTRPMNIAAVSLIVILVFSGFFYYSPQGFVDNSGHPIAYMSVIKSIYVSIVAFASMDYGDSLPAFDHWLKYTCAIEGLIGIFLITLFVATISRKMIRT